ncbi:ABC transporter substrate-binding protein [Paenibacillus mucilaginosus]|uniref:ABC transporter substrate-binding protein n=2 Tax=Paenibacillus mucilaginosus TaxID=61624 RepID=I0BTZ4_9BACL|nr:ABC transporter substrate-binding protein [Paenibacillus mucilaginosus]AEI45872.1 probable ABC transporter substrate binding protein [Paenibacillus mucilaginosus KNP414]AFH65841.1 ABC transporter substrate-binding protein [Paenibacillus mucilaginosus K02]MCG7217790.1 ABC transporter substrate-binding protein [Paenibacillus mucilaginosus]WDM27238.1 SgrR family transcriptional regulator [Paenibacillus mucilaginosus]
MKLRDHYLRLRRHFPQAEDGQALAVALDELAGVLDCTHRNVTLLLKRMRAEGWIGWEPKRGRGSRSPLTFFCPLEEMLFSAARELVLRGDLQGALARLQTADSGPGLQERFHRWLGGYFGHRSEVRGARRLDTLRFPLSQQVASLDPAGTLFTADAHLVHQLFDPLLRYNRVTKTLSPHVAHAWEADLSRLRWTFHLRKGVLFHHGRELTADDVCATFARLRGRADGSLYGWVHRRIASVEAQDPVTVTFTLEEPCELLPQYLATTRASIVPAELSEQADFSRNPVGTGPFRLSHLDETLCVLDAFPGYFQGRAHLDRVELWHAPGLQEQERTRTLGSFQLLHNYLLPVEDDAGSWHQVQQQGATCRFLTFNLRKQGPLASPVLREALCTALHPAKVLERVGGDATYAAASLVRGDAELPPQQTQDEVQPPEACLEALRRAGYAGERLVLCTIPQYERDAKLVQALLQETGWAVEVKLLGAEAFKSEQRLQADLLLFSMVLDNDAELRLVDLYKSMQRHLEPSAKEAVAAKISTLLGETEALRREQLLLGTEEELRSRRLLHILYFKRLKTVYHASVRGISLDSLEWVSFKDIWFQTR